MIMNSNLMVDILDVDNLSLPALDYLVAAANGYTVANGHDRYRVWDRDDKYVGSIFPPNTENKFPTWTSLYNPSSNIVQTYPLIEKHGIVTLSCSTTAGIDYKEWFAGVDFHYSTGPNMLVAICRFVVVNVEIDLKVPKILQG